MHVCQRLVYTWRSNRFWEFQNIFLSLTTLLVPNYVLALLCSAKKQKQNIIKIILNQGAQKVVCDLPVDHKLLNVISSFSGQIERLIKLVHTQFAWTTRLCFLHCSIFTFTQSFMLQDRLALLCHLLIQWLNAYLYVLSAASRHTPQNHAEDDNCFLYREMPAAFLGDCEPCLFES